MVASHGHENFRCNHADGIQITISRNWSRLTFWRNSGYVTGYGALFLSKPRKGWKLGRSRGGLEIWEKVNFGELKMLRLWLIWFEPNVVEKGFLIFGSLIGNWGVSKLVKYWIAIINTFRIEFILGRNCLFIACLSQKHNFSDVFLEDNTLNSQLVFKMSVLI